MGTILSAQGPHNESFGFLWGAKGGRGGSLGSFWVAKGLKMTHFWMGHMMATKSTPEGKCCFLSDVGSLLTSLLALQLTKNLLKIRSNFGVEKCKNRTAADGPHDKREMPACVSRSVNTEVKSTSAVSKHVHVFLCSFVNGVRFCTCLKFNLCPKTY